MTKTATQTTKTTRKAQKSNQSHKTSQNRNQSDRDSHKTEPYRAGSCYAAVVSGLLKLGKGKTHDWDSIVQAVAAELAASKKASEFKSREKRNENGLGWKDRIVQNVRVVARTDYGAPLRKALKMEVRTSGKEGAGIFALK